MCTGAISSAPLAASGRRTRSRSVPSTWPGRGKPTPTPTSAGNGKRRLDHETAHSLHLARPARARVGHRASRRGRRGARLERHHPRGAGGRRAEQHRHDEDPGHGAPGGARRAELHQPPLRALRGPGGGAAGRGSGGRERGGRSRRPRAADPALRKRRPAGQGDRDRRARVRGGPGPPSRRDGEGSRHCGRAGRGRGDARPPQERRRVRPRAVHAGHRSRAVAAHAQPGPGSSLGTRSGDGGGQPARDATAMGPGHSVHALDGGAAAPAVAAGARERGLRARLQRGQARGREGQRRPHARAGRNGPLLVRGLTAELEPDRPRRRWPRRLDAWEQARLFALLNAAMADGFIAAADTRYLYNFWRPVTAIRAGDTDGNDATTPDPAWESYVNTPSMPDYPSTHSVLGAAATAVLARFLGTDQVGFTMTSGAPFASITRSFTSFSQAARENAESRILGGIHFRSACENGLALGESIGRRAMAHHLQPYQP